MLNITMYSGKWIGIISLDKKTIVNSIKVYFHLRQHLVITLLKMWFWFFQFIWKYRIVREYRICGYLITRLEYWMYSKRVIIIIRIIVK